jgi:penicillin-binding protein 2
MFVCFAPRENPTIAIAVVVENAGFGATWGGNIAQLLMEKYLTDSLRPERAKKAAEIAAANLMPGWLEREQYKADSTRAYFYYKLTKDSNYIRRFLPKPKPPVKKDSTLPKPVNRIAVGRFEVTEPKKIPDYKNRMVV